MAFKTDQLIEELINLCKNHIYEAERYQKMDLETLNWKETPDRWSILECLEHLNLYGDFYIPEIRKRMADISAIAVRSESHGSCFPREECIRTSRNASGKE